MGLFSKLQDYNNLLEEILDRKTFSSIAKSLLLSMIYKLEISYKDYEKVKTCAISKDDFLRNVLDVIQKYCDNIKTVEPDSNQAELLIKHNVYAVTNEKERSMLVYPTELAMLYAIADIEPKYFYIKNDFMFKKTLQKALVTGYKQNTVEILKNFSGWSWDINSSEKFNCAFNLIYQNLMMIKGEQFLYDWRTDNLAKQNYLYELKRFIKKATGNDNYYLSLCKLLYIISSEKEKESIKQQIENKKVEYKKLSNIPGQDENKISKELKKIKNYDAILNNKKTVNEELVELQKYFLAYIEKKILEAQVREDIFEIIFNLRYYENMFFSKNILIKDCEELQDELDRIWKLAITKACKIGTMKIISMDIDTNFQIIKYILDTRIIDLEEIKIYLSIEDEKIFIKVYDKEIFEKKKEIKFNGNKKDIVFKKKKIIKLFN